jgi:hypothetical protein
LPGGIVVQGYDHLLPEQGLLEGRDGTVG